MTCIVIGLLAVLTLSVYASTSAHPTTPNIVGTWKVFSFDEQANYSGRRIIRGTIRMDSPDHLIGNGSADVIDVEGKVTKNAFESIA